MEFASGIWNFYSLLLSLFLDILFSPMFFSLDIILVASLVGLKARSLKGGSVANEATMSSWLMYQ